MKFSLISLLMIGLMGASASAKNYEVQMKSISYAPKNLQIQPGDTVEWVNASYTDHSASESDKTFDTGLVAPGKSSKKIRFDQPGTFRYHCSIHGLSMSGEIDVTPKRKP